VLVTYGDRIHLLEDVVHALLKQDVKRIVVVDNGSAPSSRDGLERLRSLFPDKFRTVHLPENTGSAKGYKSGLQEAYSCGDCEFIWLLDDDNLPAGDALRVLLDNWNSLCGESYTANVALVSLRKDRKPFADISRGVPVNKWFGRQNSFLGFHILDLPSIVLRRILRRERRSSGKHVGRAVIPFAPYGGLFFHRSLLERIGYPSEDFFLYHDDFEFTYRVTALSGKIYLISGSVVEDIDSPWHKSHFSYKISYLHDGDDSRVYYVVRNRVYLERYCLKYDNPIWRMNMMIYLNIMRYVALLTGVKQRFDIIDKAVRDGADGKLGRYE
jgi:GT2 family glycosyltransferase